MSYKVIHGSNLAEVEKTVNEYLKLGWRLYGDLKVTLLSTNNPPIIAFYQTLVKES